jgi:glucokinase
MDPGYIVGVDLGGTKILTARCDLAGQVLAQARLPTLAEEGPDAVLARIFATIQTVLAGCDPAHLRGVGIGSPGTLDNATGTVFDPPNLPGWRVVPLRDRVRAWLQAEVGRTARVEVGNDANAAALGEYRFGAGTAYPGLRHMVYMTVSTGIGGGVISDGRLLMGRRGMAGEVGHITVDVHGPRCACGNIGCLEVLAAGPAIARAGAALVSRGRAPFLAQLVGGEPARVTSELVEQAARQDDPDACALMAQIGHYLGVGVVTMIHLFNPELICIGGGVSKAGALIFDPLIQTVDALALPAMRAGVDIVPARLGDRAGVLGAAALVL